jgi:glycine/D-amino acid oxidase-like deaminating enzyme
LKYDIAIVGGGIAGASLAAEIAPHARVVVLEAEERPGYHSTGRSAAFWSESYGGQGIQPLTTASGPLLSAGGYLDPMGALHIGRAEEAAEIEAFVAEFDGTGVPLYTADPHDLIPGLRSEWTLGVISSFRRAWNRPSAMATGRSRRARAASKPTSSSMRRAPGPIRSRLPAASRPSASSLIAARSCS